MGYHLSKGAFMSMATASPGACVERLEDRLFLSASPEKFNLMNLLGYDRRGSWHKYRSTISVDSDFGAGTSKTVSTKVSIASKKKEYDGHASNVVKTTEIGGGATATSAWYRDSSGIYGTAQVNSNNGVTISA
jgi:hypothetical protein